MLELLRVDDRSNRLIDGFLVAQRVAVRGSIRELVVAAPNVRDDLRIGTRHRDLKFCVAEQITEAVY